MKKLLYLMFILSICIGFPACGDDDEPEPEPEKPWTWNGDWNDPNDPNYKPEGYNPLKGIWEKISDGMLLVFYEDFNIYTEYYDNYYEKWVKNHDAEKYTVNDTGYRFVYLFSGKVQTKEYILENRDGELILKIRDQASVPGQWVEFKRVLE